MTGATVTAMYIHVLEGCNKMNIPALAEIVGVHVTGHSLNRNYQILKSLHQAGNLRAYAVTCILCLTKSIQGTLCICVVFSALFDCLGNAFRDETNS